MKRKRIDTPHPHPHPCQVNNQVNNKKLTTDKDGNFIAPNGTHLKNWIIEKTIQGGTFGKVIRCTQIGNSEVSVAIKTFKLKFTNCSKNEIKILKYLSENDPQGKEKIVKYIEDFKFNVAIAHFYELYNFFKKNIKLGLSNDCLKSFVRLIL